MTGDEIIDSILKAFPVLYYGTSDLLPRGQSYHCKETDYSPEFFICHPDDLDDFKKALIGVRRLVHIKDESEADQLARIRKTARNLLEIAILEGGKP